MTYSPKIKNNLVTELVNRGFPQEVIDILRERGIVSLNPIQTQALETGLLDGVNLVVIAPTSSGKTLVAELAAIHHALNAKGTFYLVSLKALAEEKYELFKRFWTSGPEPLLRTGITTGDRDLDDDNLSQCKITFATYEKLYTLVRENPSLLKHISLIVVDEIQTLGDAWRGFGLEALLTIVRLRNPSIQILGLSATVPNPDDLADWLDAKICRTYSRDIPLIEQIWSERKIHSKLFGTGLESLQEKANPTKSASTLEIVRYLISKGQTPIAVFCMTKPRAEELARAHFEVLQKTGLLSKPKRALQDLKQLLLFWTEGGPTGKSLMDVIEAGIAFHHADLSLDERRVVEDGIRDGKIQVTYSTTTLGQGVNLPIAVVLFDEIYRSWANRYIDKGEYLNMSGRAGRRGLQDEGGTAILISRTARDRKRMNQFLSEEAETVKSTLEDAPLDSIVLGLVASQNAPRITGIRQFIENSLFGSTNSIINPRLLKHRLSEVPAVIQQLQGDGFVSPTSRKDEYRATALGRVTSQKGITPRTAINIIRGLGVLNDALGQTKNDFSRKAEELAPAIIHLFCDCDENGFLLYRDFSATRFLESKRSQVCCLRDFEDSREPYRLLQTAWVLGEWIKGRGYTNLCSPFRNVREGYIRASADHISWIIDSASAISRVPHLNVNSRVARFLSSLSKRLAFGVTEPSIALMDVIRNRTALGVVLRGIGRSKVQEIITNGFDDLTKVLEGNEAKLLRILGSKEQVANLKIAIARYLDRSSGFRRANHTLRGKQFSRDELVKAVYESLGKSFETAVYNLLDSISLHVELLDERKVPGCADLLLKSASGNIQVECKTRKSDKGQITNTEAFEVLGKTSVGGRPVAHATVGKPGFVDQAIKNSFDKSVCLITHQTIVEAVLLVLEGRKTKNDVEALFLSRHYVEPSEFGLKH